MTLGQEFGGYAANVAHAAAELERTAAQLSELNLGATAVGTGLNAGDDYTRAAIANLRRYTGLPLRAAANRFRVTQSMGDVLAYSGALRRLSVEVGKIASDLRLLSMGPRAGIAEIRLPAVQPGSSIMPGKVNPSVPEMVNQVCYQVIGCDAAILAAADAGQLELNVMMPVIAWNALHATVILDQAMHVLDERASGESRLTPLARVSCSTAAPRSRPRSARTSVTLKPQRSRSCRSKPDVRSATSSASAVSWQDEELDAILSPLAMTSPGRPGHEERETEAVNRVVPVLLVALALLAPAADGQQRQQHGRLFPPENLPDARRARPRRLAASGSDHGRPQHRRRQRRRRPRRGERLVHDPARPAGGAERQGVRRGHSAADDRGDQAASAAREPQLQQRHHSTRHGR